MSDSDNFIWLVLVIRCKVDDRHRSRIFMNVGGQTPFRELIVSTKHYEVA